MNSKLGVLKDVFDITFKILIKTVRFGIENKVLVNDLEEALVIGALASFIC